MDWWLPPSAKLAPRNLSTISVVAEQQRIPQSARLPGCALGSSLGATTRAPSCARRTFCRHAVWIPLPRHPRDVQEWQSRFPAASRAITLRPGRQPFFDQRTSAVRAAVEYADDAGLFVVLGLHRPAVGAFDRLQETREVPFVFVESAAAELASALSAEAVGNRLARGLVETLLQNGDQLGIANARRFELPLRLFEIGRFSRGQLRRDQRHTGANAACTTFQELVSCDFHSGTPPHACKRR
jgi:hypothetical protein